MGEAQFVDGQVVGQLENGVFEQMIHTRHIYRRFNAKGIDCRLHRALKGKCDKWRIVFKDTNQVLSIPYERLTRSGFEYEPGGGVARQIMVRLDYFDEEKPVSQIRMI